MDTNEIPIINAIPEKYRGWAVLLFLASPYVTRAFYALVNGGGIKGIFTSIWLGTNTPKNGATAPRSGISAPLVALTAAFGLSALLAGCTTPSNGIVTVTGIVDAAMKDWAQASVAGRTTPELDAKVIAAHNKYREVCASAEIVLQAAKANGEKPDDAAALRTIRAAVDPLFDLLWPVLPDRMSQLETKLQKASAP